MGALGGVGRDTASRGEKISCGAGLPYLPAEAQFSFRTLDCDGILIPKNTPHRLSNESSESVLVLEVQFGELLSEDDIERMDDDYGREE